MSTTMAAPAARQTAVLAAIAALHIGAYILVAAGLRPPPISDWFQQRPIVTLPPPLAPTAETRPDPVGALEVDLGPVAKPELYIPVADELPLADADLRVSERVDAGSSPALPVPEDRGPAIRMRDARLQALIDRCYPSAARRLGQEGRGVARVDVDAAGRASGWRVEQSTGFPQLDPGMGCVARQVPFEPARRDGRAVEATVLMPIAFQLH